MKKDSDMSNDNHRIIGKLYFWGFKKYRLLHNTFDYFYDLFQVNCNELSQNSIMKYDYFTSGTDGAKVGFTSILSNKTLNTTTKDNSELFIERIRKYIKKLGKDDTLKFNHTLIDILQTTTDYALSGVRTSTGMNADPSLEQYDKIDKQNLLMYYDMKSQYFDLSYNIYLLVYFAVHKRLPSNFGYGANYIKDLEEFNAEVVCKYGITSKPGVRAITNLAKRTNERPNIFALYEYADMLYYGSENGPKKDLRLAFDTYKSLSSYTSIGNNSVCHPLAMWSLSYIYYNYHQPKTELLNCDTLDEIESLTRLEQIEKAIIYANYAYSLNQSPAAANILGKISALSNEEIDGIQELKSRYGLKSALEYFEFAKHQGYVYAYANLALIYLEQIFTDPNNAQIHLDNYLSTLNEQAIQNEPWAANTLGLFYLFGEVKSRKTSETQSFPKRINRNIAHTYFQQASSDYIDKNSGWAIANLIVYFPEDYEGRINTLFDHIEKLKETHNESAFNFLEDKLRDTYKSYFSAADCDKLLQSLH